MEVLVVAITLLVTFSLKNSHGLSQSFSGGVSFVEYMLQKFSYLNITKIGSELVQHGDECGFACLEVPSCFSYNLAVFSDINGKLSCELLPSDKYKNSDKLFNSPMFHHFSITSPCSSDPCTNNSICVAKYRDKDYRCECAPGYTGKLCDIGPFFGTDCHKIKTQGKDKSGMYWLDSDGGSHSNAFQAYCDMMSYNGGSTICYTTNEYVKARTEVTYDASFPYGTVGYRSNCNNIPFTEVMFVDHQSGKKAYFKRKLDEPLTAAASYEKGANTYGLWDAVGASQYYSYQLLICDNSFYSGFLVSGYTNNCYKRCAHWCYDKYSPFFRTASSDHQYKGVAFNTNGAPPNVVDNRLVSVGLR